MVLASQLGGRGLNGPTAVGDRLIGPRVEGQQQNSLPAGRWDLCSRATTSAVQNQLSAYQIAVTVPGMSWYPMFAAVTSPFAPPTPNVPGQLVDISTAASKAFYESELKNAAHQKFGNQRPPCADAVAKAMSCGMSRALTQWLAGVTVTRVMGTGPVRSFAPPHVWVGHAVRDVVNMLPGGMV